MSEKGSKTQGKAVITGASSGIGRVYADRLAQQGFDLVLIARRADRLAAAATELHDSYGVAVETVVADLAHPEQLERVALQLERDEAIRFLVNNAGTNVIGMLAEVRAEALLPLLQINSVAPLRLLLAVLPGFTRRNEGTIVNIGSAVGVEAYPGTAVYSGTKAFLERVTEGLKAELAGTAIRVQLVAPAATVSEIWDVQGWPLSALPPEVVMTTENCVDAALRGLEAGEGLTFPSVEDASLVQNYVKASAALFAATQTGKPASRYASAV